MTAALYDDGPARRVVMPTHRPSSRVAGALVAAILVAAACAAAVLLTERHAGATTVTATLQNYAFNPPTLNIKVGDTVTWTNLDDAPHTVTSMSGPTQVSSPTLNKGDKFSYTFTKAGTYKLYSAVHPNMTETVVVGTAGSASTGSPSPSNSTGGSSGAGSMPGMGGMSGGSGTGSGSGSAGSGHPASTPSAGSKQTASTPGCGNTMLVNAMLNPFIIHLDKAHLEESPGQQAQQALNVDNYALIHTVMVEDMVMPLITAIQDSLNGIDPFIAHLNSAHLQQSPGQQLNALLNVDQYTQLHTVLVEDMLNPATQSLTGTYGC